MNNNFILNSISTCSYILIGDYVTNMQQLVKVPVTVNSKTFEGENFIGFCGFSPNCERFLMNLQKFYGASLGAPGFPKKEGCGP